MAKGVQKIKAKKKSRKNVMAGDLYQIATDITVVDVDEDGISDLVFTHKVDKNGANWVDANVTWYGLPSEISGAFIEALAEVGFIDDEVVETNKINVVTKHWKDLTKALAKINKIGDGLVVLLGEEVLD